MVGGYKFTDALMSLLIAVSAIIGNIVKYSHGGHAPPDDRLRRVDATRRIAAEIEDVVVVRIHWRALADQRGRYF